MDTPTRIRSVMDLVASGRSRRGASSFGEVQDWADALRLVDGASRIAVVTGFYILEAEAAETDGPGGALVLARALERDGKRSLVVTDSRCFDLLAAGAAALDGAPSLLSADEAREIWAWSPDLLLYVERPGRCPDGCFRNMRGSDISPCTAPLDDAALEAPGRSVPIVAIGDGGNEAGMGRFRKGLALKYPSFASCLCDITADAALAVDVSNWGAYGLAVLLSAERGLWLGHSPDEEERLLRALASAGAVDGLTRRAEITVDGFSLEAQREIVASLKTLWTSWMGVTSSRSGPTDA
ncbi:MAG: DUF4392 domain-containing protein [Synergistaceae bacterium]|nr:DUF4392 domain-containing protein [Synergistaceae bacterium]